MEPQKPLKISFCTTCKGRAHNLKVSLPHNLRVLRSYPDAEIVVLDYNSQDGLQDWIKSNYGKEINAGRIRYARYADAEHFNMPHARNMAHRIATGDVLCNLDADNMLAAGTAEWLNEQFGKNPNIIIYPDYFEAGRLNDKREKDGEKPLRGIMGRIAIGRDNFFALRGYNEAYQAGWEDRNFTARADKAGLRSVELPPDRYGDVIQHTNEARIENMAPQNASATMAAMAASREKRMERFHQESDPKTLKVNVDGGVGIGTVTINFAETPTVIGPLEKIGRKDAKDIAMG